MNIKKLSEVLSFIIIAFGIFVVIPTWFEPMKESRSEVLSIMLILLSLQVVILNVRLRIISEDL